MCVQMTRRSDPRLMCTDDPERYQVGSECHSAAIYGQRRSSHRERYTSTDQDHGDQERCRQYVRYWKYKGGLSRVCGMFVASRPPLTLWQDSLKHHGQHIMAAALQSREPVPRCTWKMHMEMLRLGLFDVAGIVLILPNEAIRAQGGLAELAFQWAWVTVIEWTLVIEMSEIIENATKFEASMNLTILRFLAYFDISKCKITEKKRSSN